jgi:hypothetical protein
MQARFATQEQAEAAVRKLSSLRGDRLRIERESGYAEFGAPEAAGQPTEGMTASVPAGSPVESFSAAAADDYATDISAAPAAAFTLSADIPAAAAEQARKVIADNGGQLL